ncbi:hypothetical protein TRP8649_02853 [Pelagimonas phthalicica]|uniref:Uncharacterized protein n=1 Tax=Pelagimonas phthalicica TaxID=1037362 RepID=A0A238JEZ7_9RHOB|nr:hypothetical protein [Pelagimonas phthalicica]SMX28727.1 hypothetical protein TRP8649_02853 [Pelagimonas phthalicica]
MRFRALFDASGEVMVKSQNGGDERCFSSWFTKPEKRFLALIHLSPDPAFQTRSPWIKEIGRIPAKAGPLAKFT